ncbi:MAG: hypothetical protein D6808_00910 [Candidatus Dadabacteria bacterium]|nr:MAG: hypothetical protein D6808_00910 [Candidatus Dadabacteria bacterium]
MSFLANFSAKLKERAEAIYGHLPISPFAYPLSDLNYGDIGSDYAYKLAQYLHIPPETIAEKLLDGLKSHCGNFLQHKGYINFKHSPSDGGLYICEDPPPISKTIVICLNLDSALTRLQRMRIASLFSLHLFLANSFADNVSAYCGKMPIAPLPKGHFFDPNIYYEIISTSDNRQSTIDKELIESLAKSCKADIIFIWSSKAIWDSSKYKSIASSTPILVRFPKEEWIKSASPVCYLPDLASLNPTQLLHMMYYLSTPINLVDLDLGMAYAGSRDNLPWYLAVTLERVKSFQCKLASVYTDKLEPDEDLRDLLVRLKYIKAQMSLAIDRGHIIQFLSRIRESLDAFNSFFNTPDLRARLANKAADGKELRAIKTAIDSFSILKPLFALDDRELREHNINRLNYRST